MLHPSVARPTGLPISPSLEGPFRPSGLSPLLCRLLTSVSRSGVSRLLQSRCRDTPQTSRGKLNRLPCTAAGFTSYALDGSGLRNLQLARPALAPRIRFLFVGSQVCSTLPSDTPSRNVPLRFATPSPPSGWGRDFHPQAIQHARHTEAPPSKLRGITKLKHAELSELLARLPLSLDVPSYRLPVRTFAHRRHIRTHLPKTPHSTRLTTGFRRKICRATSSSPSNAAIHRETD